MQPWRGRWRLVLAVLICAATGLKLPKRFARVHHSVVVIRPLHATDTGGESAWAETRRRRDVLTSHSNVEIHVPMGVDGSFTLHLRRNDQLFSPDFQATVLNTSDTDESPVQTAFNVDHTEWWTGSVAGASAFSATSVHIDPESGLFTGYVGLGDAMFMVEPAKAFFPSDSGAAHEMIWYNASDLELDTSWLHNATPRCPGTWGSAGAPHRDHLGTRYEPRTGRNRRTGPAAGNDVCNIAVIADYKWYQQHGNNYATAAQAMLVSIEYANTRLREATIGDRSYGVAVQRLVVLSSPAVDPFYRINSQWGAMDLLNRLGEPGVMSGLQPPFEHHAHCLVHLFTGYDLAGGIQGLAWVGSSSSACASRTDADPTAACNAGCSGICAGFGCTSQSAYLNTGYTTAINNGGPVPILMRMLVTTHEFGHAFGSFHDDDTTRPQQCFGTSSGNFLMASESVSGTSPNNVIFSSCSVADMAITVESQGSCFRQTPQSLCGNGVVEPGGLDGDISTTADNEECDAGFNGDNCCSSSCKLSSGAVCSFANEPCCGTDCQLAGTSVVCYRSVENDIECRATTNCNGLNASCPVLEEKPRGTPCGDKGYCAGPGAASGPCLPWCSHFGAQQCDCELTVDACSICCVNDPNTDPYCPPGHSYDAITLMCAPAGGGTSLVPLRPFGATCISPPDVIFDDSSTYVDPAGLPFSRSDVYLAPNSRCHGGLCNDVGLCVPQSSDLLKDISNVFSSAATISVFRAWMKDNVVGAVIILTGLPWILLSVIMCIRDARKRRLLQEKHANQIHQSNTFMLH